MRNIYISLTNKIKITNIHHYKSERILQNKNVLLPAREVGLFMTF
jgi:hypothetical protein